MTISLAEPHLTLARQQAAQAGYDDLSEYVRHLIERDADRAATVAAVREGLADVAAGRVRPADAVLADLARKHGIPLPRVTEP